MNCEPARIVLSAHLDHEAEQEEAALALAHMGECNGCRAWWASIAGANRFLRIRTAESVPDLSGVVLLKAHPVSPGRGQWIRYALAFVASSELMLALPGLVAGHGAASVHDARHVGSFGSAIAIGLLYVAWRPARAFGILPIVVALAMTMSVAAVIDIWSGRTNGVAEAHHVLEVAGLWLVWALANRPLPRRLQAVRPSRPHPLHPL